MILSVPLKANLNKVLHLLGKTPSLSVRDGLKGVPEGLRHADGNLLRFFLFHGIHLITFNDNGNGSLRMLGIVLVDIRMQRN